MNDRLLKALRCEEVDRPPVWLMRQAGRYMPQYRAYKERYSLWEMFHTPEVAAEITCLPMELLGVDAAILFSDILVIAECLGLGLAFPDKGGPRVHPPLKNAYDVMALPLIAPQEALGYVFETIVRVKGKIDVPLIGFCGGPFTLASYFIDSTSAQAFQHTLRWIEEDPVSFHLLLEKITQATILYVQGQIEAGVDVIQVFDSWANMLSDEQFAAFCLPYLQKIVAACGKTPVILFCRSSSLRVTELARLQPAGISCDWHVPMHELRKKVPASIAIQGNFNPEFLKSSPSEITKGVKDLVAACKGFRGIIVNLGHGVTPDIPLENVQAFVSAVKN